MRGIGHTAAKLARPDANDLAVSPDPVALGECASAIELGAKPSLLGCEMGVSGQFPLDEQRRDDKDTRPVDDGEVAGKVERVFGISQIGRAHV